MRDKESSPGYYISPKLCSLSQTEETIREALQRVSETFEGALPFNVRFLHPSDLEDSPEKQPGMEEGGPGTRTIALTLSPSPREAIRVLGSGIVFRYLTMTSNVDDLVEMFRALFKTEPPPK